MGVTLGVTPYTFSVSGSLPAGLSIDSSSGIITGTPTATGTQNFVVSVTDAIGSTASRSYSISVANVSMPLIASSSLASGVTGSSYMQVLQASGGASPYTFTLTSGTLPAGLTITESTGTISGTPIVAGTSSL
ncbi:hypothetical protein EBZ37_01805, partial [bacterium]|nr:hypothetical protein [bacterium]